jgi:hypothetical protein
MLRVSLLVPAGVALLLTSCASNPAPCPDTQAIVDSMTTHHQDIVRLTVFATPPGGGACCAVASSLASKRGKPTDPEDLQAMSTGKTVILQEPGALDVTVPILPKDGRYTASAGVTLKAPAGTKQDALVARAESLAREVAQAMEANLKKK